MWISLKSRLPDEGVPVWGAAIGQFPIMVSLVDTGEGLLWENVYLYYPSDEVWACESEMDDDYSWITHWQPLPEPPEEE